MLPHMTHKEPEGAKSLRFLSDTVLTCQQENFCLTCDSFCCSALSV